MTIPTDAARCNGKNVLITGAASGLGEAIATSYAKAGARTIIADRNEELGRALERQLTALDYEAKYVFVDVVSVSSQAAMLREALAWIPESQALDTLILCAGINGNPFDPVPEDRAALSDPKTLSSLEKNGATMQVNLISVVQLVQLAVKYAMGLEPSQQERSVRLGPKSITLIASLASYRALPRAVDYSAAKWGLRGAFKSWRQQLPKVGMRINLVAPAFVRTPLLGETTQMFEKIGVKFATKEDVVAAVHHVIEDERCNGRAYCVSSEGFTDLNDNATGRDAFDVMDSLVARGAIGSAGCPIGHDETNEP